jgi:hypothetical protein
MALNQYDPYDFGSWNYAMPSSQNTLSTDLMGRSLGTTIPEPFATPNGFMDPGPQTDWQSMLTSKTSMVPMGNDYLSGFDAPTLGGATPPAAAPRSLFDSFFNSRDQQGWGGLAIGGALGLANTFLGMKQYSLAKDSLNASRSQFERNFSAQRDLTNSRLEDRQRARLNSSGGSGVYESVGSYMDRYGVK